MFRRSNAGATEGKTQGSQGPQAADAPAKSRPPAEMGKGRPTPKRSEAEAKRYRTITGSTTSGRGPASSAPADKRKLTPEEKSKARSERNQQLAAMRRGEDWALSPRDQGPVRRLVRDYVDGHRRPSEFYMYALLAMLVVMFMGQSSKALSNYLQIVLLLIIVVIAVDAFLVRRSVLKLVAQRFPGESTRGIAFYAIMRLIQIRRFRTPVPRIKPGDPY